MQAGVIDQVVARASQELFGRPLVTNIVRAILVEAMLARALVDDWTWCSADYAGWDFQSSCGVRLEVKQSAARQSWAPQDAPASKSSFDIAARIGRYDGKVWIPEPGRAAHIYVFAHHPRIDPQADHRDPAQWDFYVVPTARLPDTRTISLTNVQRFVQPVGIDGVRAALAEAQQRLRNQELE
jgi:hypothetical protein